MGKIPMDLETQAIFYVAKLQPGDLILDNDPEIEEFRRHIPRALSRRALRLEWAGFDRWVVRPALRRVLLEYEDADESLALVMGGH